jgi:hypothetical protein
MRYTAIPRACALACCARQLTCPNKRREPARCE